MNIDELISRYAEAEDTVGHVVFTPPQQEARTLKAEKDELKQQVASLQKSRDESPETAKS